MINKLPPLVHIGTLLLLPSSAHLKSSRLRLMPRTHCLDAPLAIEERIYCIYLRQNMLLAKEARLIIQHASSGRPTSNSQALIL